MLEPSILWAIVVIGVPTVVGAWIDFCLYDEQPYIRRVLEDGWTIFDNMKMREFGQKEASKALKLFDEIFGDRLWSATRWRSVAFIMIGTLVVTFIWAAKWLWDLLFGSIGIGDFPRSDLELWVHVLGQLPIQALGWAVGLSFTRWISSIVARLPGGNRGPRIRYCPRSVRRAVAVLGSSADVAARDSN